MRRVASDVVYDVSISQPAAVQPLVPVQTGGEAVSVVDCLPKSAVTVTREWEETEIVPFGDIKVICLKSTTDHFRGFVFCENNNRWLCSLIYDFGFPRAYGITFHVRDGVDEESLLQRIRNIVPKKRSARYFGLIQAGSAISVLAMVYCAGIFPVLETLESLALTMVLVLLCSAGGMGMDNFIGMFYSEIDEAAFRLARALEREVGKQTQKRERKKRRELAEKRLSSCC